jgi:hypothetical protein
MRGSRFRADAIPAKIPLGDKPDNDNTNQPITMTDDELNGISRTLSQLRESVAQWKSRYQEMVKTCCVTGAEREKILKEAQSEIEFWKSRSINFEATLRTIRFIAVDSDIRQLASEALDKSNDL